MKKTTVLLVLMGLLILPACAIAQESAKEAVTQAEDLKKLSGEYFAKNDYEGFYQYLKGLSSPGPEVYYYLALARQKNIDYWQETKDWEGVYDKSDSYKKEIKDNLELAEGALKGRPDPEILLKVRYLKWAATAKADSPGTGTGLFDDLVNAARQAADSGSPASLETVKEIADGLSGLEDKNLSRRLYEIYAGKIIVSGLPSSDLKQSAEKFLAGNNMYMAKELFNAYLGRISDDKELRAREIVNIAGLFAHQGTREGSDPVFAEEMYKKAYEAAGSSVFDGNSQYLRAFNLERMKEYGPASEEYRKLLNDHADYADKAAVDFRLGVITAYALKDIDAAGGYFIKAKEEAAGGALAQSCLYQLGLLEQWKGEEEKAKVFYGDCLALPAENSPDTQNNEIYRMCHDRMAEIEENKEIKYNLKVFLDTIFKKTIEGGLQEASSLNVDLTGRPPEQGAGEPVHFVITTSSPQTGCMTPVFSYEWSGETGSITNIPNSPELSTDYPLGGIKVVNVAVIGPQGPEGAGFDMVEITEKK